jgi:hypothetical protein
MILEEKIKAKIEGKLGENILSITSLSGGCISNAYRITTQDKTNYFLKYNSAFSNDMFIKEANGLKELIKSYLNILIQEIGRKISPKSSDSDLRICTNSPRNLLDILKTIILDRIFKKIFQMNKKRLIG